MKDITLCTYDCMTDVIPGHILSTRSYTPFMYDILKCVSAFYCHVQLKQKFLRTDSSPGVALLKDSNQSQNLWHITH